MCESKSACPGSDQRSYGFEKTTKLNTQHARRQSCLAVIEPWTLQLPVTCMHVSMFFFVNPRINSYYTKDISEHHPLNVVCRPGIEPRASLFQVYHQTHHTTEFVIIHTSTAKVISECRPINVVSQTGIKPGTLLFKTTISALSYLSDIRRSVDDEIHIKL